MKEKHYWLTDKVLLIKQANRLCIGYSLPHNKKEKRSVKANSFSLATPY